MTTASVRTFTSFKSKTQSQLKSALEYIGASEGEDAVGLVLDSENELHTLGKNVLIKCYKEAVPTGKASIEDGETPALMAWYGTTDMSNEHVNAIASMLSHNREHFQKMLGGELGESEFDIEEMVKCYQLTGLSESDSRVLVDECAYFANKFTKQLNPVFTPQFRYQLFEGLMEDFADAKSDFLMDNRGSIGKFALAKKIMGEYMESQAEAIEKSLWTLSLQSITGESI